MKNFKNSILLLSLIFFFSFKLKDNVSALIKSGTEKFIAGDMNGAIIDLNKAIAIDPKNFEAYSILGDVRYAQNDDKGAMENYNKSLELNPLNSLTFKKRGKVKAHLADYRGSILDFNKSIELNPLFSDAIFDRVLSYFYLKEKRLATKFFQN